MNLQNYLKASLQKAIAQSGNMRKLAAEREMDYSTINRFNSGSNAIENMPIRTLQKIFPELQIFCFQSDLPHSVSPPVVGDDMIVDELSHLVKNLEPRQKLRLLTIAAANFPEYMVKESQKISEQEES